MSTTGKTDGTVTLLQFLRVIPSSAWLRSSILWADDLAAIWPLRDPVPLNQAQDQSLREVRSLISAGLFLRKPLDGFFISLETSVGRRDAFPTPRTLDQVPHTPGWDEDGPGAGPGREASAVELDEDDLDTFLYPNKLPETVTEELLRRGLIIPRPDGRGYTVRSAESLDQLLAGYARVLHATSGGCLLPAVEDPRQARRIAAPVKVGGVSRQAIVLTMRAGVAPDLDTDFRRFIDFRANSRNEHARRDYIEQLTGLWNELAKGGPDHACKETLRRVTSDLDAARQSYFERVTARELAGQVLTSFSMIIPLKADHSATAIIEAILGIGGAVMAVPVRNNAPRYIRRATKAELLARTVF